MRGFELDPAPVDLLLVRASTRLPEEGSREGGGLAYPFTFKPLDNRHIRSKGGPRSAKLKYFFINFYVFSAL